MSDEIKNLSNVVAIKRFFELPGQDGIVRSTTTPELKDLPPEAREELGKLAKQELIEAEADKA